MNKIDYINRVASNIFSAGIPAREAFILCAVAKLQWAGKEEVTSHDVSKLIGDSHISPTMKKMRFWFNIRVARNSLNKMTYYYSLTDKGTEKIERIIA